jgi:hypothetical protein
LKDAGSLVEATFQLQSLCTDVNFKDLTVDLAAIVRERSLELARYVGETRIVTAKLKEYGEKGLFPKHLRTADKLQIEDDLPNTDIKDFPSLYPLTNALTQAREEWSKADATARNIKKACFLKVLEAKNKTLRFAILINCLQGSREATVARLKVFRDATNQDSLISDDELDSIATIALAHYFNSRFLNSPHSYENEEEISYSPLDLLQSVLEPTTQNEYGKSPHQLCQAFVKYFNTQ